MKSLPPQDSHRLKAAAGWLELGNLEEATTELESIALQLRGHPDVLQVRCKIYCEAEKWDYAAEVANALTRLLPDQYGQRPRPIRSAVGSSAIMPNHFQAQK